MHILKTRVLLDDPMKGQKKKRIGLVSFKKLVRTLPPCIDFADFLLFEVRSLTTAYQPSSPTGECGPTS